MARCHPPHSTMAQNPLIVTECDVKICDLVQNRDFAKSVFGLAIHPNDHQARRRFVEWAQHEIAVIPDFHKRILFSDEVHFWLNGYVSKKQNCRIWSEANPQVYVETPLHHWSMRISLQTLDHLERDNIRCVIADIRPQMLEKSSKIGRPDWTTSEPAVAVLCQKSYLKCNATRLSFE
ncbi:hypothetical protein TNCV_733041 [Trichonephila clavipes]|nr:hypothetical protein TNCV_733041 [Trichonephila clavipes]